MSRRTNAEKRRAARAGEARHATETRATGERLATALTMVLVSRVADRLLGGLRPPPATEPDECTGPDCAGLR